MTLFPRTIPLPSQLPDPERARLAGRAVALEIPRAVRLRLRHPEKLSVSEWAEQHRRVTAIDAAPGPWDTSLVPHTRKIMDTIGRPWVRQVWLCMVERSAKTQICINAVCWGIDRGSASGNIFWLLPTEADARKALGERLIPVFQESPRIKRYLTDYRDDATRSLVRFRHGIRLFAAWANSPGSMASYFGRLNVADEIDKYPERTSEGTDPITLFLKRAREDRERSKYIFASTPGQKYIWKGTQACDQVWEYASRCPHCGERHVMSPDNLSGTDDGPVMVVVETRHALSLQNTQTPPLPPPAQKTPGYACPACGALWTEADRRLAYLEGSWTCTKGADLPRPEKIGFHFPALPNPVIPLAEIAAARERAAAGGFTEQCAWHNGYLATDYVPATTGVIEAAHLLRYRAEIPRGIVPPDTARLCLLVDTQQASFYYQLWAYGYGPRIDLHLVRHGIVELFEDLEGLLADDYKDAEGTVYRISAGLIDSGGTRRGWQKHSRTVEVYEWCARNRTMMPGKGMHGRTGDLISYKQIDALPGSNKRIPGSLKRANIRVDLFKDDLERRLAIEPDDPGALSFHREIDDKFAEHYTAEHKDEHGDWQHDRKKRNDYWDCTVYALALREILKTRIPRAPDKDGPTSPPAQRDKKQRHNRRW